VRDQFSESIKEIDGFVTREKPPAKGKNKQITKPQASASHKRVAHMHVFNHLDLNDSMPPQWRIEKIPREISYSFHTSDSSIMPNSSIHEDESRDSSPRTTFANHVSSSLASICNCVSP
jgi:hypothetical protein